MAPSNEDLPKDLQHFDTEDPSITKLVDVDEKFPLPETEALWHMGQSKEHRHLLKHPVITSFLWLKWARIRPFFNRNLRFYCLFVYLLTWYIFENFGGIGLKAEKAATILFFYGLFIAFSIIMTAFIVIDGINDLKEKQRINATRFDYENFNDEDNNSQDLSPGQVLVFILSRWTEAALIAGKNKIYTTRKYPLCGYILSVLAHTTAWDRHWGGDESLN